MKRKYLWPLGIVLICGTRDCMLYHSTLIPVNVFDVQLFQTSASTFHPSWGSISTAVAFESPSTPNWVFQGMNQF